MPAEDKAATSVVEELIRGCQFEPVRIGGWREVSLMEAPRRHGAVYGEAYGPDEIENRRVVGEAAEERGEGEDAEADRKDPAAQPVAERAEGELLEFIARLTLPRYVGTYTPTR